MTLPFEPISAMLVVIAAQFSENENRELQIANRPG
jgi:hypothetical protein